MRGVRWKDSELASLGTAIPYLVLFMQLWLALRPLPSKTFTARNNFTDILLCSVTLEIPFEYPRQKVIRPSLNSFPNIFGLFWVLGQVSMTWKLWIRRALHSCAVVDRLSFTFMVYLQSTRSSECTSLWLALGSQQVWNSISTSKLGDSGFCAE